MSCNVAVVGTFTVVPPKGKASSLMSSPNSMAMPAKASAGAADASGRAAIQADPPRIVACLGEPMWSSLSGTTQST